MAFPNGSITDRRAKVLGRGQTLRRVFVAGAAANTDMAVAGLKAGDIVVSLVSWNAGVPTDQSANGTIGSVPGAVRSTANTTGNQVEVWYYSL